MKKNDIIKFIVCLLLLQATTVFAQENLPFWAEIQAFKKEDSLHRPPDDAILFVGSSTFRLWKNIHQSFPAHTIINRGFGGSALPDVIRYAKDIIFPYHPKQVVIYCGENDLSGTVTGDTVFQRFKTLYASIRSKLPETHVVYVSMKPSPSRWHLKAKMENGNKLIKEFLKGKKNTAYVDVWNAMLNEQGEPQTELFVADKLHMNEKGCAIWQKLIEPFLLKDKAQ